LAETSDVNARCPRCGGGFHCGALEGSCGCAGVVLDGATRDALRLKFEGCLCIACLRALQAERDAGLARQAGPPARA
jgi:hypothetical protein